MMLSKIGKTLKSNEKPPQLVMQSGNITPESLRRLFENNPDLDRILGYLNQFNPMKVMRLEYKEEVHSNILRWLLDPGGGHGLGDRFLKGFISEALVRHGAGCPSAQEVLRSDMTDAIVDTEWTSKKKKMRIDLLVRCARNGWVFVIENKINHKQGKRQLRNYLKIARKEIVDGKIYLFPRGIFLTLSGEEPRDPNFAPIQYKAVGKLIGALMDEHKDSRSPEATFMRHYHETIEEITGMSKELRESEQVALQLYQEHQQEIDFISDVVGSELKKTGFPLATGSLFGQGEEYPQSAKIGKQDVICIGKKPWFVDFLPGKWFDKLGGKGAYKKWERGLPPLYLRLSLSVNRKNRNGWIALQARFHPSLDRKFQENYAKEASNQPKKLRLLGVVKGDIGDEGVQPSISFEKWWLYKIKDVDDKKLIVGKMKKALRKFRPEFDTVAEIIPRCSEHGQRKEECA